MERKGIREGLGAEGVGEGCEVAPAEQASEGPTGTFERLAVSKGSPDCLLSGATRFSCPPHFTEMSPDADPPRFSLEALTGPDTELWLIRAPADFAPQR